MIAHKYNIQNENPNLPKWKYIELTMLGISKKDQHDESLTQQTRFTVGKSCKTFIVGEI